ncbi:hypothetical protein M422DRAFT_270145 [Sphaerobolus stellatus SS14]|uniref:Uncharacterized protein n=1 Tax=Sphaerobolus stellatus (strain SS14) TaxID=990650 RepID=A0A0C9UHX4_SPHS4|nr:hypothetical protein M422DRAFT_270145 [Sphaerobolus stellatus SS14]
MSHNENRGLGLYGTCQAPTVRSLVLLPRQHFIHRPPLSPSCLSITVTHPSPHPSSTSEMRRSTIHAPTSLWDAMPPPPASCLPFYSPHSHCTIQPLHYGCALFPVTLRTICSPPLADSHLRWPAGCCAAASRRLLAILFTTLPFHHPATSLWLHPLSCHPPHHVQPTSCRSAPLLAYGTPYHLLPPTHCLFIPHSPILPSSRFIMAPHPFPPPSPHSVACHLSLRTAIGLWDAMPPPPIHPPLFLLHSCHMGPLCPNLLLSTCPHLYSTI